eukprot:294836-Pleurochrysis_carterae.AAC.1
MSSGKAPHGRVWYSVACKMSWAAQACNLHQEAEQREADAERVERRLKLPLAETKQRGRHNHQHHRQDFLC